MKILHVIPSVSKAHGGPSAAITAIEQGLTARRIEVTTISTDDDGPGRRLRVPGDLAASHCARRVYFRKWTEFYKVAPGIIPWLCLHVREYDVVHIHALFSFTSVAAALIARFSRVPYLLRPLGTLTRYGVTRRRPGLKRLSLCFIEGPSLKRAAAVHFTSATEHAEALELGLPMTAAVIPLGVPVASRGHPESLLGTLPQTKDRLRLVFLSRLDPKKNVEGLLKAIALMRDQGLRLTLLVGGSGDPNYVQSLYVLASTLGVADQVHWLGHVDGEAKADLLAAGDVFVLPSHSENFGIAVVEAMAAGLPCVLGRGIAIADVVQSSGAGVMVDPEPTAIAAGIRKYVERDDLRAAAGEAAACLAMTQYSVERMCIDLERLYQAVRLKPGLLRRHT